jgi:hypothetical protein
MLRIPFRFLMVCSFRPGDCSTTPNDSRVADDRLSSQRPLELMNRYSPNRSRRESSPDRAFALQTPPAGNEIVSVVHGQRLGRNWKKTQQGSIRMNENVIRRSSAARGGANTSSRRLIFAGVLGAGLAIGLAVPAFAGPSAGHASQTLAGSGTCTMNQTGSSASIVCSPNVPPAGIGGAPSQEQLTAKNAQRGHWGA